MAQIIVVEDDVYMREELIDVLEKGFMSGFKPDMKPFFKKKIESVRERSLSVIAPFGMDG